MQRRAVAIYLVFFAVLAAGAYGLIQTTSAPSVAVDGPTQKDGDRVTFGDRTYDLSVENGSGELSWTNESAVFEATIENGSTVPPADVVWDSSPLPSSSTERS